MLDDVKRVLKRLSFGLCIPLISCIHFYLNTYREDTKKLESIIDVAIPFCQIFIIPYMYWFLYIGLGILFFAIFDHRRYYRLLISLSTGMLISFIVFYYCPTTVPRPVVNGNDVLSQLVRFIYSTDNPYDCFPSIHVLNSMFVTLFFCEYDKGKKLKMFSIISCVLISLSTVFIKQHYVIDIVGAICISMPVYILFKNEYVWSKIPVNRILAKREKSTV